MDSMEVTIRLKSTFYIVDAVFQLFNTGQAATEWVGFPKTGMAVLREVIDFIKFEGWVDGQKAPFLEEGHLFRKQGPFFTRVTSVGVWESRWMVTQLTFPAHAKRTIHVRYEAKYAADRFAVYHYGTGRYWKGNIGRAVFIVDSTDIGGIKNAPVHFRASRGSRMIAENVVMYELSDFKPGATAILEVERFKNVVPDPRYRP
jgi:hypothetical protein